MTTSRIPAQRPARPLADPGGRSTADDAGRLRLAAGVQVIQRDAHRLQIGTDPRRRVILQNPPDRAAEVLTSLDGLEPVARVLDRMGAEPALWRELLAELLEAGMLGQVDGPAAAGGMLGHDADRAHLTHRYGARQAEVLLGRRADAIVEIRGSGALACALALQLAAAGIGHVAQVPDRPLRQHDLLPPLPAAAAAAAATAPAPATAPAVAAAAADDRSLLAARLRTVSERVQVQALAGHQRAALVVLAGDGPADAVRARALLDQDIAHLATWAGAASAVIGPMVLPGISSCLWCAELTRTDADRQWPLVRQVLQTDPQPPPAVLAAGGAALATAEVLDLVQGTERPSTVDGTIEWNAAGLPRRRSWARHPQCHCGGR